MWKSRVGPKPKQGITTDALSNGNIAKLSSKYLSFHIQSVLSWVAPKKLLFAETVTSQRAVSKLLLSACSYITHLQTCSGMLREHRGNGNVKSVETMGWGAMLSNSVFWTRPGCYGHKLTARAATYVRLGPSASIMHRRRFETQLSLRVYGQLTVAKAQAVISCSCSSK